MKKLENMTKEELIEDAKESKKWWIINAWTRIIGTSILIVILAVGLWLKLG